MNSAPVLFLIFRTLCWAQLCPRLAQHRLGFARLAVIWMVFPFLLFVVFAFVFVCVLVLVLVVVVVVVVVCHLFAHVCSTSHIRYLTHWLLRRTLFTCITFRNIAFPKTFLKMVFSQNHGLHICFGWNVNCGLNKTNVFASQPSFPQRPFLHKNRVVHKHHVLHKSHVLTGPVRGPFAACRITLSMVAGGTRPRRLNNKYE